MLSMLWRPDCAGDLTGPDNTRASQGRAPSPVLIVHAVPGHQAWFSYDRLAANQTGEPELLRSIGQVGGGQLVAARKLATSEEILLWMTPSEAPKALQASECSELLDPMRASCWISAQH